MRQVAQVPDLGAGPASWLARTGQSHTCQPDACARGRHGLQASSPCPAGKEPRRALTGPGRVWASGAPRPDVCPREGLPMGVRAVLARTPLGSGREAAIFLCPLGRARPPPRSAPWNPCGAQEARRSLKTQQHALFRLPAGAGRMQVRFVGAPARRRSQISKYPVIDRGRHGVLGGPTWLVTGST